MKEPDIHLCMVALSAYPVLAGRGDLGDVGGAQVQQAMVARALVRVGVRVTVVCFDYGQADVEDFDGVRVLRSFDPDAGLPGLRFFHPRLSGLRAALARADADVYYQRSAGAVTGLIGQWCRQHRRPMIYAGASDLDFLPGPPNLSRWRDRRLYAYGLKSADAVVVQNPSQMNALRERHGRCGIFIPSCYEPAAVSAANGPGDASEVLWVGMIRKVKRPERLLKLAQALPQLRFRMIGGQVGESPEARAYYRQVEAQAKALPNVTFMGLVPFDRIDPWFARARVLVNTSDDEGFPNTFLQAWSHAVPCLALFDTGSRIDGLCPYALVRDEQALAARLQELMGSDALRHRLGQLGKRYFQAEHSTDRVAADYRRLLGSLLHGRSGQGKEPEA